MRQAFENGFCVAAIAKHFWGTRTRGLAGGKERLINEVKECFPSIASQSTKSLCLFIITILPDHNWGWRLILDAEWTPPRPTGLPRQKSAQACMIARRRSKLSVRR